MSFYMAQEGRHLLNGAIEGIKNAASGEGRALENY
jgi:hypothetical protein